MAFRGALVRKNANATANYTTGTAIPFDVEVYDTDAFHDNVTDNTKLIIPSGMTRARFTGQVGFNNDLVVGDDVYLEVKKNGSALTPRLVTQNAASSRTGPKFQIETPIIDCVAGDFFELFVTVETDTSSTLVATETWFNIVDPDSETTTFSGAYVSKMANETAANYTGFPSVEWDLEILDVGGWFAGGSPSDPILTAPHTGYLELRGQVSVSSIGTGDGTEMRLFKNGAAMTPDVTNRVTDAATSLCRQLFSYVDACTAGDTYELKFDTVADTSITVVAAESWFSARKIA